MFADSIEYFKKYDYSFLGLALTIFVLGVLNLYSATHSNPSLEGIYKTQIFYFFISMMIGVIVSFINPKNLFRYSYIIYGFNIFLLILVLVLGKIGMGAQRWLVLGPFRLQPSELMKISTVLALARWFCKANPERGLVLKDLIFPSFIAFIPAILIIIQPDLGTGLLILLIYAVLVYYRKLHWKSITILAFIGLISGGVMYKYGLKEYQRKRIQTFINPYADAKGSGYNAIQSEIAIGSGRLFGKGYMKSSQGALAFLPENHTDFVFSIFNEEHGFIGALFLIVLYLILLLRFIWLSTAVLHFYESIVVIGLMSIFFWHTLVNMSMVMGLMPVVGLPLPFMSYGGSSLLTFGVVIGLATSISNSRNLF